MDNQDWHKSIDNKLSRILTIMEKQENDREEDRGHLGGKKTIFICLVIIILTLYAGFDLSLVDPFGYWS